MPDQYEELDAEALVIDYLKGRAAVTALVPAAAISTRLRRGWQAGEPALRIRRIGGTATEATAAHLVRYRVQVEAFAGTTADASALARRVDLELRRMPASSFPGAVVTDVRKDLGISDVGDPDSDSERYLFGAVLYAHAVTS